MAPPPSRFRDFITFLSTLNGDLANITAPPQFVAPLSVVELPSCWTERPSLFNSAARESSPEKRALRILHWILCSFKSQFYVGQDAGAGLKKPLNAFLGELFFCQWTDSTGTAGTITEQVSHHPPITACYMWDDEHGIRGEGYTRVEMSFSGSLNVKQIGHAMVHIDKYNENYLIPLPEFKVKGLLSGCLYPELVGTYHIISSTGFISEIKFSGKGFFSGNKNNFEAKLYHRDDKSKTPLYVASGQWSSEFTIKEAATGTIIEKVVLSSLPSVKPSVTNLTDPDPWESRNAWKGVLEAHKDGDMQRMVSEKTKLEVAQRAMRKEEIASGIQWEPKFFSSAPEDPTFEELASATGWRSQSERTKGIWKFDAEKAKRAKKPYHGERTPFG